MDPQIAGVCLNCARRAENETAYWICRFTASRRRALGMGLNVAQVSNLLYRRLPAGEACDMWDAFEFTSARGLEIRDTAD